MTSSPAVHRRIDTNGISLHIVEQGEGPLVVCCHGFPGLWYSWRHQLPALAEAGYRAVAVDMRGYGGSDRPQAPESYDSEQQIGDMLGLLEVLGETNAIWVGHDFGAALVCNLAVRQPLRVRALVVMACPYDFDLAGRSGMGSTPPPPPERYAQMAFGSPVDKPSTCFARLASQHFFHMHYFQEEGPADRELAGNAREFLTRLFFALSADGRLLDWSAWPAGGTGYLDVLAEAPALPWSWLGEDDLDVYEQAYLAAGPELAFRGGLNNYRVADRNWKIGAAWADHDIQPPCLFISGASDPVLQMIAPDALQTMERRCEDLRGVAIIPGAGHFVQQEQPRLTNEALLAFLSGL